MTLVREAHLILEQHNRNSHKKICNCVRNFENLSDVRNGKTHGAARIGNWEEFLPTTNAMGQLALACGGMQQQIHTFCKVKKWNSKSIYNVIYSTFFPVVVTAWAQAWGSNRWGGGLALEARRQAQPARNKISEQSVHRLATLSSLLFYCNRRISALKWFEEPLPAIHGVASQCFGNFWIETNAYFIHWQAIC